MTNPMVIKKSFHVRRAAAAKKRLRVGEPAPEAVPRIARLMALAIRLDEMIREGLVKDQAEIARLGQVSRARVTQVMLLNSLAPSIQAAILGNSGRLAPRQVTEREMRSVTTACDWEIQLETLDSLTQKPVVST